MYIIVCRYIIRIPRAFTKIITNYNLYNMRSNAIYQNIIITYNIYVKSIH